MLTTSLFAAPAFPGAEGFGAQVTGGRGGVTVAVTRLDDPLPAQQGTLRYALTMNTPRIVVFNTGGVIRLSEQIRVAPNVTIAGQTAPGDGITIDGSISLGRNSIVRYIRIRPGAVASADALEIGDTDVIIDHCSLSWANDENIGFKRLDHDPDRNVTIQWSIIAEAEKGALAWYAHKTTFHHNLFAHNYIRNPVFAGGNYPHVLDYRNNVVYDIGNHGLALKGYVHANVVGNYFKVGNESRLHRYCVNIEGDPPTPDVKVYLQDIYGPRVALGEPQWSEVRYQDIWGMADESMHRVSIPFAAPPVTTQDSHTAYQLVLQHAGANVPLRDSVDERIVQDLLERLNPATYPRSTTEVRTLAASEWTSLYYRTGNPLQDTDKDGMPDQWEIDNGLNPNDASDANKDSNGDGYTNIETYINALADGMSAPAPAPVNQQPNADAGADQTLASPDGKPVEVQLDGSGSSDPEGQPLTYIWAWQDANGNNLQASGVAPKVSLPVGVTTITLVVNDGVQNSLPAMVTITVTLGNRAPSAAEVTISPAAPTASDTLTASATSTDPDGDTVTFTWQWYRDGTLQQGLTGNTVAADLTIAGQTWRAVATPSDGTLTGPAGDASVTIADDPQTQPKPPTAPTVTIAPNAPVTADSLVATASGSTASDGGTVTYTYAWHCDGDLQADITGNTVAASATAKGDTWRVVMTPWNGDVAGPTAEASVTIGNTPPTGPTVQLTPANPADSDTIVATESGCTDADGDSITCTWQWFRNGELQAGLTGDTVAAEATAAGDTWRAVATPTDGTDTGPSGEASVTIAEDAVAQPAPPTAPTVTLTPANPTVSDDLVVTASGSTSPDGLEVTYSYAWYCDARLQTRHADKTVIETKWTQLDDHWRVVVTPYVGDVAGPSAQASVTIAEDPVTEPAPPTAPTVTIAPDAPVTADSLVATASGSTASDGGTVSYTHAWYRNGSVQADITGNTVAASATAKGETWRVVVTPWNGDVAGPTAEASVTIGNTPPTGPTVQLTPANPVDSDTIVATESGCTDADGDSITCTWQWFRNGEPQAGLTGDTVAAEATAAGDTWRAVATPTDGTDTGPSGEASVTIAQDPVTEPAPPTQPTVTITPAPPTVSDDLVVTASGSTSPDGLEVTYRYEWYCNARLQTRHADKTVIEAKWTQVGDSWRVVVTPYADGVAGPSNWTRVIIEEDAPAEPAAPTAPTVTIAPDAPLTAGSLVATASDSTASDGGTISYTYAWYRNGSVQADITGNTVAASATAKGETWRVVVTPWHGDVAGPTAEASVSIGNTPPTAPTVTVTPDTPTDADDLHAEASGGTDADGDAITYLYRWSRDGAHVAAHDDQTTVPASATSAGETWRCMVVASDGTDYSEVAWHEVTVSAAVAENTPPSVSEVEITPASPSASDTLLATAYGWHDAEGAIPAYKWEWQKKQRGSWITIAGAESDTLTPDKFGPRDNIRVICTPWDGSSFGQSVSAEVCISNSKPKQPSSLQTSASLPASYDLTVTVPDAVDDDGAPVTYEYEWSVSNDWGLNWARWQCDGNTVDCSATSTGQLWQVRARSSNGIDFSEWTDPVYITIGDTLRRQLPAGVHLLSLPIRPFDGSPASLLPGSAVVSYDSRAGYEPDVEEMELGRGYWVRSDAPLDCEILGALADDTWTTTLDRRGLHILGNPYAEPLPWRSITSSGIAPFGWFYDSADRAYRLVGAVEGVEIAEEIPPWSGFWAYAMGDGAEVTISRNAVPAASETGTLSLAKRDVSDWVIRLVASSADGLDADNFIGVLQGRATSLANPPAPAAGYLDLYVAGANGERNAIDIAGQQAQKLVWDIVVEADRPGQVTTISYPDLSEVPEDYRLILIDRDSGEQHYMRTTPSYQFRSDAGGRRNLRIIAERDNRSPGGVTGLMAQQARDRVIISYNLPQTASVDVAIMNMAGRTVRQLVAGAAVPAGQQSLSWNMVAGTGARVPAGTYLCRITARAASGQEASALHTFQLHL